MIIEPRFGYYPWWPEDGDEWLHPDDVELARELIPSMRVYRREGHEGEFDLLHYGEEIRLRVKHTLWQEVEGEGFEVGDWVEVLSRGMHNQPYTGTIRERLWDSHEQGLRYQILVAGKPIPNQYTAEDLRHVDPTAGKLGG